MFEIRYTPDGEPIKPIEPVRPHQPTFFKFRKAIVHWLCRLLKVDYDPDAQQLGYKEYMINSESYGMAMCNYESACERYNPIQRSGRGKSRHTNDIRSGNPDSLRKYGIPPTIGIAERIASKFGVKKLPSIFYK